MDYDPKQDLGAAVRFLNGLLEKSVSLVRHVDTQANIIIGLSSAVFLFSATQLSRNGETAYLAVLTISSAISAIVGLFAIHPPRFMRKKGQEESLMYMRKIWSYGSGEKYGEELERVTGDRDTTIKQYAREIYNLAAYYYRPKRFLFNISRNIFIIGLVLSLALFVVKILT